MALPCRAPRAPCIWATPAVFFLDEECSLRIAPVFYDLMTATP